METRILLVDDNPNVIFFVQPALEQEVGYDAVWQEFEHGRVLRSCKDHIFIYDNGTWGYIE